MRWFSPRLFLVFNLHVLEKKALLRSFWKPCFQSLYKYECHWTCEHVIPKSRLRNNKAVNDLRNLVLLPRTLNAARSNAMYVDDDDHSVPVQYVETDLYAYTVSPRGFTPPTAFKKVIASSIANMRVRYPNLKHTIDKHVMRPKTREKWLSTTPCVSVDTHLSSWNAFVANVQIK